MPAEDTTYVDLNSVDTKSDPFEANAFTGSSSDPFKSAAITTDPFGGGSKANESKKDSFGFPTSDNFGSAGPGASNFSSEVPDSAEKSSDQNVYDDLTYYSTVNETSASTEGPKSLDWFLVGSAKEKSTTGGTSTTNTFGKSAQNLTMVSAEYMDILNMPKT